jgi:hypothetical protein
MRLPLVMQGVSKRVLQLYSLCYCAGSVTKTFTLKDVQSIHRSRCLRLPPGYAYPRLRPIQCGIVNISQPCRPKWPFGEMAFLCLLYIILVIGQNVSALYWGRNVSFRWQAATEVLNWSLREAPVVIDCYTHSRSLFFPSIKYIDTGHVKSKHILLILYVSILLHCIVQ